MTYNIKLERKNSKDMDYNNSSRRFRPWGSRVMALSIKCHSLALRTESREERVFSSGINCMSVWEWLEWERKCSETVVGLDLMLVLSTARRVFVKSFLETSLSFTYILSITTVTLNHVDHIFSVRSNVWSDGACFTCSVKGITCEAVSNVWTSGAILSTAEEAWRKMPDWWR